MDSGQLSANLLKWLATFQAGADVSQPEDISDGVIIATVLHEIEPQWFDEAWLSKIKTDAGDNWRLKVSNLKKVTQGIKDYLSDRLDLNISHRAQPDVNKLGEAASAEEAGRLLQLVLGVAVNCSRKQEYIKSIQNELEPAVQAALMTAIQELPESGEPLPGSPGSLLDPDPLPALASELDRVKDERHQIQQRCYQLNNQITVMQEERSVMQAENQRLQKQLELQKSLPEPGEEGESPEQRQRYKHVYQKLAANNEEIYKLETAREELRARCDLIERDLAETRAKNEELQRLADETRPLRDELEILREQTARVPQLEDKLDTYQKRLQELGDLRRQIKQLQDKNADCLQHNLELEEELKLKGSYRPQLDLYKKQVAELRDQLSEESRRRDKAELELRRLADRLAALQSEKERLLEEGAKLRAENDDLMLAHLQPPDPGDGPGPRLDTAGTDIREQLHSLQRENRQLRDQEADHRALLDDLRGRETALQADNRWAPDHVTIRHIHEIKLCTSPEPARHGSPADSGVRLSPNALLREYVDQLVSSASTPRRHSPIICGVPEPAGCSHCLSAHQQGHEGVYSQRRTPEHGGMSRCEHGQVQRSPSAAYTEEYIRRLQDMATSTTELLPAGDAASLVSCEDALSVASSRGPQRFTRQGSVKYKQERWPGAQRQRPLKVPARKEDSLDSGCGCSSRWTTLEARRLDIECASGTTAATGVTERSDGYLERRLSFIGRYDAGGSVGAVSDDTGSLLDEPLYLSLTTPSKDSALDSRATPSLASGEEFHPELLRSFSPAARLGPLAERSPPREDDHSSERRSDEPNMVRWRSRSFRRPRRSRSRSKSKNRRSRLLDTVGVLGATFAMCAP